MSNLVKIWQNPYFHGSSFWAFRYINSLMRDNTYQISKRDLSLIKFKNNTEIRTYFVNFINKFANHIYTQKHKLPQNRIFYRGEHRNFDNKIGDIICYNQFTRRCRRPRCGKSKLG